MEGRRDDGSRRGSDTSRRAERRRQGADLRKGCCCEAPEGARATDGGCCMRSARGASQLDWHAGNLPNACRNAEPVPKRIIIMLSSCDHLRQIFVCTNLDAPRQISPGFSPIHSSLPSQRSAAYRIKKISRCRDCKSVTHYIHRHTRGHLFFHSPSIETLITHPSSISDQQFQDA